MHVILDISSDEEEGSKEGFTVTDFNWIKEMLFTSDVESDDSDEVVEICCNKSVLKSKSSTLAVKDDDDDDCVVLEGDPEKGASSVVEEANGSDELLVIGEKGQVACRDYPHARHLCAILPFSSTPHEKHCNQCHCYVCDSLAPCLKWGTGLFSSDHCHANDKVEVWKTQRKNFKLGRSSPLLASTNFGTSLRPGYPKCNEFLPPLGVIHLSPNSVLPNQATRSNAMCTAPSLSSIPQTQTTWPTMTCSLSTSSLNSSVQNQVSRPTNNPIMSTATSITMPNGAGPGRSQESRPTSVRNKYLQRPALGVRSHTIQRERGNGASNLRPHVLRPHMMSKGVGSDGNIPTVNNSSRASSGFSNHVNMTQQHDSYHAAIGLSNYRNCNRPFDVSCATNISFYSLPCTESAGLNSVNQHTVASEMQAYSQPLPQLDSTQDYYQPCIQVNDAPSSYEVHLNGGQHENEPQVRSHASENTTQCGNASQDTCQPKPHEESPSETAGKFSAFDSCWTGNAGQSILQSSGFVGQPPYVQESGGQFIGSNEPPPSSLVEFDNWLLEKDLFPVVTDGVLPPDLLIPSPELDIDIDHD
ncbi:hypothetical protein CR513_62587, partial [Mucuna pruriens]